MTTKKLYDGTEVPIDTPTKVINGERFLLTAEEISLRQTEEAEANIKRKNYEDNEAYKDKRRIKISSLDGEGMDAMRKAIAQLYSDANKVPPVELTEYLTKVETIKSENPKPVKKGN